MTPNFRQQAKQNKRHIVLPEGDSPRILEAAVYCDQEGIAKITVLGDRDEITQNLDALKLSLGDIEIISIDDYEASGAFAETLYQRCLSRKLTKANAEDLCKDPLIFADLMVQEGHVDACVAGIKHTSGDVIRAALKAIGPKKPKSRPSSIFILESEVFPTPVVFADCAMNIAPNVQQLTDIAYQSSRSIKSLLGLDAKIAMLSFSTNGSAYHRDVNKVRQATELLKEQHPELNVIGEIQFDAAISKDILKKKWPESDFDAPANVFIFPNLDAANTAYKIAEQMGKAKAIGPILQGLAKPVNDLSRGANVSSIIDTIAVTCLQVED